MHVFGVIGEKKWFPLNLNMFEEATQKNFIYYRKNAKGEDVQYALCPECGNPIQIIGLYSHLKNTDKPYGRHCSETVEGLAAFNRTAFDYCSLAHPGRVLDRKSRRSAESSKDIEILNVLRENFDQIAYLFQQETGIYMSKALAQSMLEQYDADNGHMYLGATQRNVPWIFAYMSHSQKLWGRRIVDPDLQETLLKVVPTAEITSANIFKTKSFTDIYFWFTDHRQGIDSSGEYKESLSFRVSYQGSVIYRKEINFDYDYFYKLCCVSAEKRPRRKELGRLVSEILGGVG